MMYCANGTCGSLGTFASPSRYLRGVGQTEDPYFGKGCDPNAAPPADERALLEQADAIRAERSAHIDQTCAGAGPGASLCATQVSQAYIGRLDAKAAELAALCDAKKSGTAPTTTAPVAAKAGMGTGMKLALVGAGLVFVVGFGYMVTR